MSWQTDFAYRFPLAWPDGRPRTPHWERKRALWKSEGNDLTYNRAISRLRDQVGAITKAGNDWRTANLVLSSNIKMTQSGARDQNYRREPEDVGAAFYFDLDGRPHALACDRWDTVAGNIGAIAAHIEALRGQERWGVGDLRQAFAGHAALPPPAPWWEILGIARDSSIEDATRAWRTAAKRHHPDAGGNRAEWDKVNEAYEAAKKELS